MEYIKSIQDYPKNTFERQIASYLYASLDDTLCREKIKNVDFMISYVQPLHDFVIYSTAFFKDDFLIKD